MNPLQDIQRQEDIRLLVDTFYSKVQAQELIGPIFNERIKDKWPEHLGKMYRFWETVLLGIHTYQGAPFAPHATLPIDAQHFEIWLGLFYETVDELFVGEKAEEAKWRAGKMAVMFQSKLEYFRRQGGISLI